MQENAEQELIIQLGILEAQFAQNFELLKAAHMALDLCDPKRGYPLETLRKVTAALETPPKTFLEWQALQGLEPALKSIIDFKYGLYYSPRDVYVKIAEIADGALKKLREARR